MNALQDILSAGLIISLSFVLFATANSASADSFEARFIAGQVALSTDHQNSAEVINTGF